MCTVLTRITRGHAGAVRSSRTGFIEASKPPWSNAADDLLNAANDLLRAAVALDEEAGQ